MTNSRTTPSRAITGLEEIIDGYDALIVDLWGVIHNGLAIYPGVETCLAALKAAGKPVCLLSNAPRRLNGIHEKLDGFGLDRVLYDHIMTSGEATHLALTRRTDPWHVAHGGRCFHLGPDRDNDVIDGITWVERVDRPEVADFVLNTGPHDYDDTLDDYLPVLGRCAAAGLPMVCANPDIVVTIGERLVMCAGMMAQHYADVLGGNVRYYGKPHPPVYGQCFELLGHPDPARVLAVGDGLKTDIAGANAIGIDSVLIAHGIHREEVGLSDDGTFDAASLDGLAQTHGATPTYVAPSFVW